MFYIRQYTEQDKKEVERWIESCNEDKEIISYFPKTTTFILEINKVPAIVGCAYFSVCGNIAYLDNAYGNPDLKGSSRSEGYKHFSEFLENFSKSLNYKLLMFSTKQEKLADKYKSWGYISQDMQVFIKILNKGVN